MTDGAMQDMLFGTASATAVDDDVAERELRLCALNVQGPSATRVGRTAEWLAGTQSNALVLSELRGAGARELVAELRAIGYAVAHHPDWQRVPYSAAVATKGFAARSVPSFDPRVAVTDLESPAGAVRVVGIYGPTNGMDFESSANRSLFQRRCLDFLAGLTGPALCLAGDLNVLEPDHQPRIPAFAEHDYAFYTGLLDLGLVDAYRAQHPDGKEHSWVSERYGSQRLDHILLSRRAGRLASMRYDHGTRGTAGLTDHSAALAVIDLLDRPEQPAR